MAAESPNDNEPTRLSGSFSAEISSGYVASGGSLCDTRPVSAQELDLAYDLGEYGWISTYGWIISSLHDGQRDQHRWYFNEFETALLYGYRLKTSAETALKTEAGALWNPQIGYFDDDYLWEYVGPHLAQRFENPIIVPYYSGLWLMCPRFRTRVRVGVQREFRLLSNLTLTPSVETVWSDGRRYVAKYGSEPAQEFLGGGFGSGRAMLKLTWRMTDNLIAYFTYKQFAVLGNRARAHIRARDDYWAKTDWPIFTVGMEYSF